MQTFSDLGLGAPLLGAVQAEGYTAPTPIQVQAIPPVLAGRDVIAIAQTGTGKTAAFTLPILERLAAAPKRPGPTGCRVLVLTPTRELAGQIAESVRVYGRALRPSCAVVVGGMPMGRQVRAMAGGVDVLVATPGRLLDHVGGGTIHLGAVETLVLDEADQMLDLGFMPAIQRIIARLPATRQTLLFSATMPPPIAALAARLMREPVRVAATPAATPAPRIDQRVLLVEAARKRAILAEILADRSIVARALVFTRTKRGADRVARQLEQDGIAASVIHGNRSQPQRERALAAFRAGSAPVLVATDIAARGIDVDGVSHVVNFDLPNIPESYVHRIGRTGRAGATGIAISLCAAEERPFLRAIENLIRQRLPSEDRRDAAAAAREAKAAPPPVQPANGAHGRPRQDRNRGGRGTGAPHRNGHGGGERQHAPPRLGERNRHDETRQQPDRPAAHARVAEVAGTDGARVLAQMGRSLFPQPGQRQSRGKGGRRSRHGGGQRASRFG